MSTLALDLETPRASAVSSAVTNGLATLIACAINFSINLASKEGRGRVNAADLTAQTVGRRTF